MILNKNGEGLTYKGVRYEIGAPIVGTKESDGYKGLFGTITEIRTSEDKETDNKTLDIYCTFDEPVLQQEINDVEARFSEAYGEKKWIEDIILDEVIMAPEMIKPLHTNKNIFPVYVVHQEWSYNGNYDSRYDIFSDYNEAKHLMHKTLKEEMYNGIISYIADNDKFVFDESDNYYKGYIDGNTAYDTDFFKISIERKLVGMQQAITDKIAKVDTVVRFIMELLPKEPSREHFWTDGESIFSDSESEINAVADLLDDLYGEGTVVTGCYDPEEDKRNGEVNDLTGYYYLFI